MSVSLFSSIFLIPHDDPVNQENNQQTQNVIVSCSHVLMKTSHIFSAHEGGSQASDVTPAMIDLK